MIKLIPDPSLGNKTENYLGGVVKILLSINSKNEKSALKDAKAEKNKNQELLQVEKKEEDSEEFSDLEDDLLQISEKPKPKTNVNGKNYYMFINIHQCRNLEAGDSSGFSDPYIRIFYLDKEVKTSTKKETINPV